MKGQTIGLRKCAVLACLVIAGLTLLVGCELLERLLGPNTGAISGTVRNLSGYSNAALDDLIDEALSATDMTTYAARVQEAEQALLDDAAAVFLYFLENA